MNTTYTRRKAAGLCPKCGEAKPDPGRVYCAACSGQIRGHYEPGRRTADAEILRVQRQAAGLCRCGGVPSPGRKGCASCLAQQRGYASRRRERGRSFRGAARLSLLTPDRLPRIVRCQPELVAAPPAT